MSLSELTADFFKVLRVGSRRILRAWRESLGVVMTISVAVGGSALVFSVFYEVLVTPLPYPSASRILFISETNLQGDAMPMSTPDVTDLRERSQTLASVASYGSDPVTAQLSNMSYSLYITAVSKDFFQVFGVSPEQGRFFAPPETVLHGSPAVIISDAWWKHSLGGRPDILGQNLRMLDMTFTIVGILPPGFSYPGKTDLWISRDILDASNDRTAHNDDVVGLLKPGISLSQSQQDFASVASRLATAYPAADADLRFGAVPLKNHLLGSFRSWTIIGMALSIGVVAVCSANLFSLFLAMLMADQPEVMLRLSFGAGRSRIITQWSGNVAILAMVGYICGMAPVGLLLHSGVRPGWLSPLQAIHPLAVFVYGLATAIATAMIAFALAAFYILSADDRQLLRSGSQGGSQQSTIRTTAARSILIIGQVAVAASVCILAMQLVHTWDTLSGKSLGFRQTGVLTAQLPSFTAANSLEQNSARARDFYSSVLSRLHAIGNVQAAAISSKVPLLGFNLNTSVTVRDAGSNSGSIPMRNSTAVRVVSEDYFKTLAIPLLAGRAFTAADAEGGEPTAIVDGAFIVDYSHGKDPLSTYLNPSGLDAPGTWLRVVGVVGDVNDITASGAPVPHLYLPLRQHPAAALNAALIAYAPGASAGTFQSLVKLVSEDAAPGTSSFQNLQDVVSTSTAPQRQRAWVASALGLCSLALACGGVLGVMSSSLRARRRELVLRVALGAPRTNVVWTMAARLLAPVAVGSLIGGALALLGGALLQHHLSDAPLTSISAYLLSSFGLLLIFGMTLILPGLAILRNLELAYLLRQE